MESPEIARITTPIEPHRLAVWYCDLAEATHNPTIWESRLRTAHRLEEWRVPLARRSPTVAEQAADRCRQPGIAGAPS